jgi:hypothetical protein
MNQRNQRRVDIFLRWVCVVPAVGLSFVACLFFAARISPSITNELSRLGLISGQLQGDGAPRYELLWDGPLAAISFVLVGAFTAPSFRRIVALVLFGWGACLTQGIVEGANMVAYSVVPPDVEKVRIACMHWASALTYATGFFAVVVVFIATGKSSTPWSA